FELVIALLKLAQSTEEEQNYRREKNDERLDAAEKPPFDIMKKMNEVLDLFEELLVLKVRGTTVDDIAVGLLFTEATIESEKINCMVNIKSIKNETTKHEMTQKVDNVYEQTINRARGLKNEAMEIING